MSTFWARQRHELVAGAQVVLHEDEVVELHVAVALAARAGSRRGRSRAPRRGRRRSPSTARTARSRPPARSCPCPRRTIRSGGMPTRFHASIATVSSSSSSTGSPSCTVAQSRSGSSFIRVGDELPGEVDRLVLEVVAEREVAEHLEEGAVPVGAADVLEVGVLAAGAQHLLDADDPRRRRLAQAEEVRLERLHARDDEERRRVVGRRDQRVRRARGGGPRSS